MPQTIEELAQMLSERDKISYQDAMKAIRACASDMEYAFYNGNLPMAEQILKEDLGLELDYFDLLVF